MEQRSDKASENRLDVIYNTQELEELSQDKSLRERNLPNTKKLRKKGDLSDAVQNTADNLKHSSKPWQFFGITETEANKFATKLVQGGNARNIALFGGLALTVVASQQHIKKCKAQDRKTVFAYMWERTKRWGRLLRVVIRREEPTKDVA